VTVGSLIRDLTAFADFYEAGSADMIRSGPSEKPSALGDCDSNADYVQRVFRATVAIDRVRAYVLARFGAELTIVSARRLLGDLIQRCALTVNAAEALPLEAAMDRLEAANERSNRRETTPADRFLAASRLQALNYLRLFDAVIALFESVQQDGSAEPPNSASILKAFEELTKALGIDRKQTWQENYRRLGIIQRTGKSLQWMAKGAFEFLDPTNRKGWGLGVIEHALVELWEQMNEAEKIVLDAPYQKAISIYKRLPPVLALWAKKNEPVGWGDDRKELTKEEMTQHVKVCHAYVLKDTWEVDACFSRWAEGGIEKADRDPMPVGPGFPEAELALDLSSKREVKPLPVEKHKDGPEPPHWLWFNGKRHRIGTKRSRLSWLLLEYFWARDSAIYEDLQGPGKPWLDPVTDSAVATAVNRFNNEMPAGFPWKLITKGRHVAKESGENPAK